MDLGDMPVFVVGHDDWYRALEAVAQGLSFLVLPDYDSDPVAVLIPYEWYEELTTDEE